jgi:hypothetical protein
MGDHGHDDAMELLETLRWCGTGGGGDMPSGRCGVTAEGRRGHCRSIVERRACSVLIMARDRHLHRNMTTIFRSPLMETNKYLFQVELHTQSR